MALRQLALTWLWLLLGVLARTAFGATLEWILSIRRPVD